MLNLALPLAATELGWMLMGLVDTMMVGRLPYSAVAIGAVSLGTTLFYAIGIFGSSIMLGLDTLISQAYGAGKLEDCHRSFFSALYLSLTIGPLMMAIMLGGMPFLTHAGIDVQLLAYAIPFLRVLTWSTLPLVLYFVLRRYLQSMTIIGPVLFASVSANLVNLAGNWTLVYGHWGLPALGVAGSAWSTFISRIYMVVVLAAATIYYDRKRSSGLWAGAMQPDFGRVHELIRLGLPAATQFLLEISAFSVTTVLVARLGALPLAGHQIALNVASLTYMIPLGIASAAAVRVGHAVGAQDVNGAARSGWVAIFMGGSFMSCSALALFLFPKLIARVYSPDPQVIRVGAALLVLAAIFQLFDGLQTVATGALRGAGNTSIPMLTHFLGYWIIGVPLGALLAYKFGWGVRGFWTGLCIALILIGSILLMVWRGVTRKMEIAGTPPIVEMDQTGTAIPGG